MTTAWRGVIEQYREFLPVSSRTPVVTLLEGNTPLVRAPRLAAAADPSLHIYLKCEGFNPTGSFKDPDTALESASRPTTVPPDLGAVLGLLGL